MKRRQFLATAGAAASFGALASAAAADSGKSKDNPREYYILQRYTVASEDKRTRLEKFFAQAAIPALNKMGIGPIAVLRYDDETDLLVLLPCQSPQVLLDANRALLNDKKFIAAAGDALKDEKKDPLYQRLTSSMLLAFEGIPKLERPTKADTRIFQLRCYENHNIERAAKKIEMFVKGGELDLFRRVGLTPVFFGETLVGPIMPNLTYMLAFDNMEQKEKAWEKFLGHDEWKAMRDDPQYADTVSNITNLFLKPAPCSQV